MMTVAVKWRLAGLGLAAALMGGLIVVVTLTLQRMAGVSRERLRQVDLESFRIAAQFRDKFRYANDKLRQFATTENAGAWEEFLNASQELKTWIEEEGPRLTTDHEKDIRTQMDVALAKYLQRAQDLRSVITANTNRVGAMLAEYSTLIEQSRRLLDLGEELGHAHYESRNQIVEHVSRTLTQLRLSVLGFVALLFIFGLALALVVSRDLIAPLRVKLVKSQALAERNEKLVSLGFLAAGVAHEIRNPLTAIKTGLFSQQKKFEPGSPGHADGQIIEREILRLERIVNEFLQFARPAQPQPVRVLAEQPLQDVQALLSPPLAGASIRIVREPSGPLALTVDAAQLKQVLINLVQNAADSIGHGGTITLRARPDRRPLTNGEVEVVVLEVADTGKGIPPEVEKRLFDPFFTTKPQGTGLGLSIAARIIEINGGALHYQTKLNRGSTFQIVLPRAP